jgi:hypothetical protein
MFTYEAIEEDDGREEPMPLAEQRRIVDKVEQLMALVDALEQPLAPPASLSQETQQAEQRQARKAP